MEGQNMSYKRKSLQELNLNDDFLFGKVMNDISIVHEFLEYLLNMEIKEIEMVNTQEVISPQYGSRGVRLDVYVKDVYNNKYNIEIQNTDRGNIPTRMRFYQSAMDVQSLDKSEDYSNLGNDYIIFICPFDLFHKGYSRYDFEYICELNSLNLKLNDGIHKIVLNANGENKNVDKNISDFLNYLCSSNQETANNSCDFVQKIHRKVLEIKSNKELEVEFLSVQEKFYENFKDGKKEGREEGHDEFYKIMKYLKSGKSEEEILKIMGDDCKSVIEKAKTLL
ncbi:Rpn family recombination-promoting nuclease/putative transposase [Clostridiaceae bacterium WCA-383-APC-5B]|uniref:Rpn family recombination-promoting nuclease/putative transposase n=2 Tax=Inconstantimicrobium porci TaxID=2652291 RepID=A0A7X2MZR3_9CLOT|nr:Rpn family recombination-promoting nuclease/putative transposase [Inconstantimicrobium porci]